MIIDFIEAKQKILQRNNEFQYNVIDILNFRNSDLDLLFERLSDAGIVTLEEMLNNYTEVEFLEKFKVNDTEKKIVKSSLKVMQLKFIG